MLDFGNSVQVETKYASIKMLSDKNEIYSCTINGEIMLYIWGKLREMGNNSG